MPHDNGNNFSCFENCRNHATYRTTIDALWVEIFLGGILTSSWRKTDNIMPLSPLIQLKLCQHYFLWFQKCYPNYHQTTILRGKRKATTHTVSLIKFLSVTLWESPSSSAYNLHISWHYFYESWSSSLGSSCFFLSKWMIILCCQQIAGVCRCLLYT